MKGKTAMDSKLDKIKNFFKKDQFVEHIGVKLVEASPGRGVARMEIKPIHLNGMGSVQGGALFTLADLAFAAAANSHGQAAVGINCSINYMKAVSVGTLTAEATEDSLNPKLGSYTVRIRDEKGDLVAIFQGLAYRKKEVIDFSKF
jgi:acyl-CoA thioesterase